MDTKGLELLQAMLEQAGNPTITLLIECSNYLSSQGGTPCVADRMEQE